MTLLITLTTALAIAAWVIPSILTLYGTWIARRHLKTPPPHLDAPFRLYPISILKPLRGADAGLRDNLESFFFLDYPEYELVFSVADPRDPARAIVESLIDRYGGRHGSRARARLIISQADPGVGQNPKVNNLSRAYREAAHDWILISDSNVRVAPDYLKRLFAHVDTSVGLVTSIVAGHAAQGAGGHLEATYLNTFYARGMVLASAAGHPCVVGKSMLFQRSTANRFGGLAALGRYLAEDYMAGEAMRKLGLRVVIAADPVPQHIGAYTFHDFWSRHIRWGRIRKSQAPGAFLAEPLMNALLSGLLGAWGLSRALEVDPLAVLVPHLLTWALCDQLLMIRLKVRRDILITPLAWMARETLALPLWIATALGQTVQWRGQNLRVLPGGILESPEAQKSTA